MLGRFKCIMVYGLSLSLVCSLKERTSDSNHRITGLTRKFAPVKSGLNDKELPTLDINQTNADENISASENLPLDCIDELSPTSQETISEDVISNRFDDKGTQTNLFEDEQRELLNKTALMKILPTMLEYFCIGGHFCFDNKNMSEMRFPDGEQSCCIECSCSPDCAKTGRCCFQDVVEEKFTECVDTAYPKQSQMYTSYRMVTSKTNDANQSNFEHCGQKIAGPWGSVNPVFSKSHKRIYKNKFCADAYDVIDGVAWDVIISYMSFNAFPFEAFLSDLHDSEISAEYRRHFKYPGDDNDVIGLVCDEDVSSTSCQRLDFQMPADIPFSQYEIMAACKSGFRSLYLKKVKFPNVFCAVCEMGSNFKPGVCTVDDEVLKVVGKGLVFLIDSTAMNGIESFYESLPQSSLRQIACVGNSCRPLLCPSGQMRNSVEECTFVFKKWYNNHYVVYLQLTADQPFNVTAAFPVLSGSDQRNIEHLRSPWPAEWFILHLSCEMETTDVYLMTNTLLVKLQYYLQSVRPSKILRDINQIKNRPWMIKTPHEEHTLQAEFVWNRNLLSDYNGETLTVQTGERKASLALPKLYVIYHVHVHYHGNIVYINQMYYCNQVELLSTEYISINSTAIYNKITGEFILFGYFFQNYARSNHYARVCLDNSGFYVSESKANYFGKDVLCILKFVGLIYIILGFH